MKRRHLAILVALLAGALACGRASPPPPHDATDIVPVGPAVAMADHPRDASTPADALPMLANLPESPAEPPLPVGKLLDAILEAARVDVYAARSREDAHARLERLEADLAAEARIPTSALSAERDQRNHHLVSLHAGPVRVYPAPRTMDWMVGVASALEGAVKKRGP